MFNQNQVNKSKPPHHRHIATFIPISFLGGSL